MISTTVRPALRIERRRPRTPRSAARSRGPRPTCSRERPSGSGRRRTRPARCSGRAADAGPCPAGRSGRVTSASAIRQRALSVPWMCCEMPMPQKMIAALGARVERARPRAASRRRCRRPAHRLGREVFDVLLQRLEALGVRLDVLLVVEPSVDDHVAACALSSAHVAARLELQHVRGVPLQAPGRADP